MGSNLKHKSFKGSRMQGKYQFDKNRFPFCKSNFSQYLMTVLLKKTLNLSMKMKLCCKHSKIKSENGSLITTHEALCDPLNFSAEKSSLYCDGWWQAREEMGVCLFYYPFFSSILFIWKFFKWPNPLGLLGWLNLIRSFLCFFLMFWVWVLRHNMLLLNSMLGLFTVWTWRVDSRTSPFLRYQHSSEQDSYNELEGTR